MKLPNGRKAQLGDKLDRYSLMNFQENDVVALTAEIQATHKETQKPIVLRHGQVGTIVMDFDGQAYLVDFSGARGNTYAMETVPAQKLMQLVYEPLLVSA